MIKKDLKVFYRKFVVYPFKDFGYVERKDNKTHEFIDSHGYRMIKDTKSIWRPVCHIVYAAGCSVVYGDCKSYNYMKNVTISYKDGNKLNCNFENLICKIKKDYLKLLQYEKSLAEYWQ